MKITKNDDWEIECTTCGQVWVYNSKDKGGLREEMKEDGWTKNNCPNGRCRQAKLTRDVIVCQQYNGLDFSVERLVGIVKAKERGDKIVVGRHNDAVDEFVLAVNDLNKLKSEYNHEKYIASLRSEGCVSIKEVLECI